MARTMLDASEAAEYLKISYWTILDKAKKGVIPHTKIGSRVLFSLEGLIEWVERQEAQSVKKDDNGIKEPEKQHYGVLRKIRE